MDWGLAQRRYKWEEVTCDAAGSSPTYGAICRLHTVGRTEVWQETHQIKYKRDSCPLGLVNHSDFGLTVGI